jgi:succinate--hydroxymethylglutarate CoA-transferase
MIQDDTRHWTMVGEHAAWKKAAGPMSNYFSAVNRNKRSVTLDLKHPQGKDILLKLVKNSDVLLVKFLPSNRGCCDLTVALHRVENFKPGTMDRLGLGYDLLKKHNPKLIYASLSGMFFYGAQTPTLSRKSGS